MPRCQGTRRRDGFDRRVRSRIEIDARGQNQDLGAPRKSERPTRGGVSMTADMIHGQQVDPGWHDVSLSAA